MTDSLSTLMAKRTVENVWARSQRQTIECTYEYVIPDLSLLTQKVGEKVDSPLFFVKGNENIRWRLNIYPSGHNDANKGYLSLFLEQVSVESDLPVYTVTFKVNLSNNGNPVASNSFAHKEFNPQLKTWGWAKFVNLGTLKNTGSYYGQTTQQTTVLKFSCHLVCELQRHWITNFTR